jgi:DNA polymerase III subunit delta
MINTLTGSNSFMLQQTLRQKVEAFLSEHGEFGLERIDGEEATYERMREAMTSLPFLVAKKLVVLRHPSAQKQFAESIAELLESVPEETDVIIVEPKLDKRSSYYKTLKKQTDYQEFSELDAPQLANWLVLSAEEQGAELSRANAQVLINRVGTNQQMLYSELQKLSIYDKQITRQSIELLTDKTPQSSIFELLDSALAGDIKRALQLYQEQRALKVEPQQIVAMLAWQLHIFAIVKTAGDRTDQQIASEAKINPFVVRKAQSAVRRLRYAAIKSLIADLHELDLAMKRRSIDLDEALQHYIVSIRFKTE